MSVRRVVANVASCTGCGLCMIGCSAEHVAGFNARYSWVKVDSDLMGVPAGIRFTHGCDRAHSSQCVFLTEVPSCVALCEPRALRYLVDTEELAS